MIRNQFKVLIIDDDQRTLQKVATEVKGTSLCMDRRTLETHVDTLQVEVESAGDSTYRFAHSTLNSLADISAHRYDLIIMDYSFAAVDVQPRQWREGEHAATPFETNDHLLTIVDLQRSVASSTSLSESKREHISKFFRSECEIVLRSFQHDRPVDYLGPYETRFNNTKGVFTRANVLRLDSFAMIYGAESDLRRQFYTEMELGRDFYRNIVLQMTLMHVHASLARKMAQLNKRILIPRATAVLALITSAIWAVAAVLASFVPGIVGEIVNGQWGNALKLLGVTVLVTILATWILTLILDRGISAVFEWSKGGD